MTYSAVDAVGDAYEATRALLLPVDLRRWLLLAVVVFFVSGTTGFDPSSSFGFLDVPTPPGPDAGSLLGGPELGLFVLLAGVAALVALAVGYVAAVMEFVFVRILERRDVRVRAYLRPNAGKGLSLFVLRLLVGLALLASFAFAFALALGGGVAFLALVLLLSPVIVVALLGLYLFHRFTVDFVVAIMLVADVGVLEGWRRLLHELRSHPSEYAVYALARVGLGIAAAIVTGIGFTMVAIVVGVPFAIVGATFYAVGALLGSGPLISTLLWGVLALYAVAVTVVGVTFVQVPVSSSLRYYALFVLADVSPRYDLVGDARSHPDDGGPPTQGGDGDPGGPGGTAATVGDEGAIELPEDVTETRPDPGGDEADETGRDDRASGTTGEDSAGDGPEPDEPSAEDPDVEDPETSGSEPDEPDSDVAGTDEQDDAETDETVAYETETEEPERYGTDGDDGR